MTKKKKSFGATLLKCGGIGTAIGAWVGKLLTKGVSRVNTNPYKGWKK